MNGRYRWGKHSPRHRRVRYPDLPGTVAYSAATVAIAGVLSVAPPQEEAAAAAKDDTTGQLPVVDDQEVAAAREARANATGFDRGLEQRAKDALLAAAEAAKPTPTPTPTPEPEPEPAPEPELDETVEPEPETTVSVEVDSELDPRRYEVLAYARAQIGEPYVYGGDGPDSWDCSGLTMMAFASVGIDIPRVSGDQHRIGQSTSISNLNPGDLVAWDGHVALYAGGGMIIEAPKPGESVRERPLADHWFDQGAWGVKLDYSSL